MAGVGDEPRDQESFIKSTRRRLTALERRLSRSGGGGGSDPTPAGVMLPFGGTVAPPGWLILAGQIISRGANPNLFAVYGTTYNTGGEAGADFRLPDARGRVLAGQSGDLEFFNVGQKGGQKRVTLTVDEMPSHDHPPLSPATAFWVGGSALSGIHWNAPVASPVSAATTGPRGGGQSHDNLPPYMVVNYIVKAG